MQEQLRHLQTLTKLKSTSPGVAGGRNELSWLLVLDNLVFAAEAEVRWLDHVETRLARERGRALETGRAPEAGRAPEVDANRAAGSQSEQPARSARR